MHRLKSVRPSVVAAALTAACSSPLDSVERTISGDLPTGVEPAGSLDAAPAVFRLRVEQGARRSSLSEYRLYSGELSDYHLGRVRARNVPATLAEREVPVLAWVEADDALIAPLVVLESGRYALATPELGLVVEVMVDTALLPVIGRAWPPPDIARGTGTAVFCGEAAGMAEPAKVTLAPTNTPASVLRGLDEAGAFSDECIRLHPDAPVAAGIPLLPPALVGGALLEPHLLVATPALPVEVACEAPELAVGPTCATVDDDRIVLRAQAAAFVALRTPEPLRGIVRPGTSLVVRGFEPSSTTQVSGLAFDSQGEPGIIDVDVTTQPARAHVVLNEVLANPAGAEASGEWIELVNDGSKSVDLAGFTLDDGTESTPLPAYRLSPGELALIVSEAYGPDPELDVVPAPNVPLLVVPRLGRSGLANAGELLRLRDPDGNVVSRMPALAAPAPGRSVARRSPEAPDEAASFGAHASPGASPGQSNAVEPL